MPPTGDVAQNPGVCPDWESNQRLFGSQAGAQSTEPHQPGHVWLYLLGVPFTLRSGSTQCFREWLPRPHDQLWRPSPQSCAATTLRPSLRPSVGGDPVEWPTAGSMGLAPGCALASGPTCLFIFLGPVSSQGMFSWGQLLGTQEAETKSLRALNLP